MNGTIIYTSGIPRKELIEATGLYGDIPLLDNIIDIFVCYLSLKLVQFDPFLVLRSLAKHSLLITKNH